MAKEYETIASGVRLRRAPIAWQEPVAVLLAICLLLSGFSYFFFWRLPAQRTALVEVEIKTIESRFLSRDLAWADRMARDLLASGRVSNKSQIARLEVLLQQIGELRAKFHCKVTFAVSPATAAVSLKAGQRIESGATLGVGDHHITFEAPGFEPEQREVVVEADGQIVELGTIQLRRRQGRLQVVAKDDEVRFSIRQIESESGIATEFVEIPETREPFSAAVPTGTYCITWSEGGVTLEGENVGVKAGEEMRIEKRFGTVPVTVQSDPPGATLWVEGEKHSRGVLPLKLDLRPISYRMTAQYEDWPSIKKEVRFHPSERGQVAFNWEYTAIDFDSQPQGARVYDGAEEIGVTPFKKVLLAGHHHFTAKLVNLDTQQVDVVLRKDHAGKADFQFVYGTLKIESEPIGAEIVLPGVPKEERPHSPCEINVRPGPVRFTMTLAGYQQVKVSHSVPAYQVSTIKAKFERP